MSLAAYKVLHLVGAFLLFAALGALALRHKDGGDREGLSKLDSISHGIALLIIVVSGFGMLARLGITHDWLFPGWVWGKLVLWLLLGAALAFVRRMPRLAAVWWWTMPLLGGLAAWMAIYQPF